MKRLFLTLLAVVLVSTAFSQITFRSGDAELDAELNTQNTEAKGDMIKFKRDLTENYKITTTKIDNLLKIMEPAEVLLSCKIGEIANRSIDDVVNSYKVNKDKGWGAIAKDMGIKPGSPEFHALKGNSKGGKGNSVSKGKGNSGKSNGKGKSKK